MSPVRPTSTSSPRLPPDSAVGGPVREVLSLDQLVTDAGTQVRSAIDDEVVDEYVQALADGAQFPPVVVFRADGAEMLADGYHRVFAYRKAGRSEIPADVYHGTREDALWFALGANRAHGQRLSGADKRRAIELAYRAWPDLSQVRIAAQDLHPENIIVESLRPDARRAGAIDDSIRAIAIDLGSISDASRSDRETLRRGDLHWIAAHLNGLVGKLLSDPDKIPDLDNRLASALQLIKQSITPSAEYQRTPGSADFIAQIEEAYYRVTQHWRPWREPLSLKAFSASYNAQTMQAWHVPQLLVDPDGQWLNGISSPGPQVITGMRGCGKTMLLRALQFHARAAQRGTESNSHIMERLEGDNYVGLFVSAQRLLDRLGDKAGTRQDSFARLFVAFGLEAVRAVHHLGDIDEASISKLAYKDLAEAISGHLTISDDIILHNLDIRP